MIQHVHKQELNNDDDDDAYDDDAYDNDDNNNTGTHFIGGWMGPRVGLDVLEKRKTPCPYRDSNPRSISP